MRSVITAISIFIVILVLIIFCSFYVKTNTAELSEQIEVIKQALYEKNWDYAESAFEKMEDKLESSAKILEAMYDHEEIDQLKTPQVRAKSFISQKQPQEAVAELSVLKSLINHLAEKDKLIFYNLL